MAPTDSSSPSSASPSCARPNSIDTLHVFFCTHLDIGYTDTIDRVAWKMKEQLDDVLRLCREHPDFNYVIEESWVLRQWLERTEDPELRREMADRIREGRIELCGAFATPHGPACGLEDLNQLFRDARQIADELGIEFVSAMQNDVPGYPWAYPQILRKSGVRYFLVGINTIIAGKLPLPPDKNPFYWEGVDGSRVLTFVQDGYCHFIHQWKFFEKFMEGRELDVVEADLRLYLDHLAESNFPYSVQGLIANPCDNLGPLDCLKMFHRIREWNASGRSPRVVVSTPTRYFEDLIQRHGDHFPVLRGDWGLSWTWSGVKVRGPAGTQLFRRAQTRLPIAEKTCALAALAYGKRFPAPEFRRAWDSMLHYGEHSAPEGSGDHRRLTRREILQSNRRHYEFAVNGFHDAEMFLELGLVALGQNLRTPEYNTIVVFNPSGWTRDGYVRCRVGAADFDSYGMPPRIVSVADLVTGEILPCDNDFTAEIGGDSVGADAQPCVNFLARGVPPMGYRLYKALYQPNRSTDDPPEVEDALESPVVPKVRTLPPDAAAPAVIENEFHRVEVDARTGALLAIVDKRTRRNLVAGQPGAFNGFSTPTPLDPASPVEVRLVVGQTFQRLEIRRPGSWMPETDFRLASGVDRVEWRNAFDRATWRVQHPNASVFHIDMNYPFAIDPDEAHVVVSGPNGFRRIPEDTLLDVALDSLPASTFFAVETPSETLLLATATDFLFLNPMRGEGETMLRNKTISQGYGPFTLRLGPPRALALEPEEGLIVHAYALTTHAGPFDPLRAQRFGIESASELPAISQPKGPVVAGRKYPFPETPPEAPALSWLRIEDPTDAERSAGVLARDEKPTAEGRIDVLVLRRTLLPGRTHFILRLQELVGAPRRTVRLVPHPSLGVKSFAHADMTEVKGDPIAMDADGGATIPIGPFETVTLALE